MFSQQPRNDHSPAFLQPLPGRAADFNHLLKQFPRETFHEQGGDRSVLLFSPENRLSGAPQGHESRACFTHTIFICREGAAFQLELEKATDTSLRFFSAQCRGHQGAFSVAVERNFDLLTIRDSSGHPSHFRQEQPWDQAPEACNFQPLPAYARVLLFNDSLQYVCFTFERIGAHPKLAGGALLTTGIRGFQGSREGWREFEVGSTILAGRGLHNLTFETEIGQFFVPGPASAGSAQHTPKSGVSVDMKDWDPDDLRDPQSPSFDLEAFGALRSLGLPPTWPPIELSLP